VYDFAKFSVKIGISFVIKSRVSIIGKPSKERLFCSKKGSELVEGGQKKHFSSIEGA